MDPVTIASLLGAGVSLVTNLVEGFDAKNAQKEAQQKSLAALDKMTKVSNEQLQMYKEKMDVWESTFGSIQQNLSDYYKSLNADILSSRHIQNIEEEFTRASDTLNSELARRGLASSGAGIAANAQLNRDLAVARAEATFNAPQQVAAAQQGYLQGIGLPQQNSIMAGMNQGFSGLQNASLAEAQMFGQQAAGAGKQAASSFAGVGNALMSGVGNALIGNSMSSNNQSAPGTSFTQPTQGLGILKEPKKYDLSKSWLANYTGGYNG